MRAKKDNTKSRPYACIIKPKLRQSKSSSDHAQRGVVKKKKTTKKHLRTIHSKQLGK